MQVWTKEFPILSVLSLVSRILSTLWFCSCSPYNPSGSGPEVTNPSDRQTVSCILDLSTLSPEIQQYQQYEFSSMCLSYQSPVIFNNFPKIKIESIYFNYFYCPDVHSYFTGINSWQSFGLVSQLTRHLHRKEKWFMGLSPPNNWSTTTSKWHFKPSSGNYGLIYIVISILLLHVCVCSYLFNYEAQVKRRE